MIYNYLDEKTIIVKLTQAPKRACFSFKLTNDVKNIVVVETKKERFLVNVYHKGTYYRVLDLDGIFEVKLSSESPLVIDNILIFEHQFNLDLLTATRKHDLDKAFEGRLFKDYKLTPNITSVEFRSSYRANAYRVYKGLLTQDENLIKKAIRNLRTLNSYYQKIDSYSDNWWNYEIGIPKDILRQIRLMYEYMDINLIFELLDDIYRMVPNYQYIINRHKNRKQELAKGANYIDILEIYLWRKYFSGDLRNIEKAHIDLYAETNYVTTGNGVYQDGSFIDHDYVAYTGSYGEVYLKGIIKIIVLLNVSGVKTDLMNERIDRYIKKGFIPFMYHGIVFDSVRGRAVSREVYSSRYIYNSYEEIFNSFYDVLGLERPNYLTLGNYAFDRMKRYLIKREDYTIALALSSEDVQTHECINGENINSWYYGLGAVYYHFKDLDLYKTGYYPTVKSKYVSGVTNTSIPLKSDMDGLRLEDSLVYRACSEENCALTYIYKSPFDKLKGAYSYYHLDGVFHVIGSDIHYEGNNDLYHTICNFPITHSIGIDTHENKIDFIINNKPYEFEILMGNLITEIYEKTASYADINMIESDKEYYNEFYLSYLDLKDIKEPKFYYQFRERDNDSKFIYKITDAYHLIKSDKGNFILSIFKDNVSVLVDGVEYKNKGLILFEDGTYYQRENSLIEINKK